MRPALLDSVVLTRDLPECSLRAGDLGTVVELYESGEVEAEFVTARGSTVAVVTLSDGDFRPVEATDVAAVRSVAVAAA
ncbi:MAG TPA: DUF4926 domain-containing protein [Thermoanaerobaculia bacterium]|nr:DUF4926 domain-containing protein [Thermoanaerobaculia bacterium]